MKRPNLCKRIPALALVLLMVFSCGFSALAEAQIINLPGTWDEMGFSITYPEEFYHIKGIFMPSVYPVVKDGIYTQLFNYYAITKEESDAFNAKALAGGLSQEDTARVLNSQSILLIVAGIDGGRGAEELVEAMHIQDNGTSALTQVGSHGDMTYFALTDPSYYSKYIEQFPADFAEEYQRLQSLLIEAMKNAEYFTPRVAGIGLLGQKVQFETADLNGAPVKSEDLFAAHAVTMVNIWATWCKPCKNEMDELGELARSLAAAGKDAVIIGICADADQETDLAREILAERKADYLNLMPYPNLLNSLNVSTIPMTIFVNREGEILLPPIKGVPSDLSKYGEIIDSLLSNTAPTDIAVPETAAEADVQSYRVFVTDPDGRPLAGAMIQFCDATSCTVGVTDAEGLAAFDAEPGVYQVHVLKAPEGYEGTAEEFTTAATYSDVTVVLQKAN